MSPEVEVIADETIESETRLKLSEFLKKWFRKYINEILGDLINLTKQKTENQYLRALIFQLYEKNGVLKEKKLITL